MLEIKLHIDDETTLDDLRRFMRSAEGVEGNQSIASHDWRGEFEGISIVMPAMERE